MLPGSCNCSCTAGLMPVSARRSVLSGSPAADLEESLLQRLGRNTHAGQHSDGPAVRVTKYPKQEVLVTERVVTKHPGLIEGSLHARARSIGEAGEHHLPQPFLPGGLPGYLSLILLACFLCTACLLTPKTSAILAQDHPATKAFSTCAASKASSIRLNATTASSPSRGSSGPPTRVLVFSFMCQS